MRRFIVATILGVLFGYAGAASAHELILKPTKMDLPGGETLPVELQSTHYFIVKEEVENTARIKAGVFHDGKLDEVPLKANEPELRIDMNVKTEPAGSTLVVANKDGEIWSVTNEGEKEGARKDLEAQGLKVVRATKTDKYAKAIVNASKDDKNYATVVGQELEIVPVTNPADAKVGEYFRVKVLMKGQPMSGPVWATYDGFAPEHESTYAYYTEGDADGTAWIKITHPGLWIVRAAVNNLPGDKGEYDSRNLRSILTFEVR